MLGCNGSKSGATEEPPQISVALDVPIETNNKNDESQSSQFLLPQMPESSSSRRKVALKPGRSLMDWIRLTHSGKSLTSTGGEIKAVTPKELDKHNQKNDAWICLKGRVYDVSHYFEYHPGGEDELMRGVGHDATNLFNEIHRWVNVESMLEKCYVGPLKSYLSRFSGAEPRKLTFIKENVIQFSEDGGESRFKWNQSESNIHITIQNNWKNVQLCDVITDLIEKKLQIQQIMDNHTYIFKMDFEEVVHDNYEIEIKDNSDVLIILKKKIIKLWKELGIPLSMHNTVIETGKKSDHFRPCKLIKRQRINYNSFLFSYQMPPGSHMIIPIGCHVMFKTVIHGKEIIRSYTPVLQYSFEEVEFIASADDILHFIVKIYSKGLLTEVLSKQEIGDKICISDYLGKFPHKKFCSSSLILLAAGTGITPMIKIIDFFLHLCENRLLLVFFNKAKKDIIYRKELTTLEGKYDKFKVHYVLSEADSCWNGDTGYIRESLLRRIIPCECVLHACVCGPPVFMNASLRCLEQLKFSEENIYTFSG